MKNGLKVNISKVLTVLNNLKWYILGTIISIIVLGLVFFFLRDYILQVFGLISIYFGGLLTKDTINKNKKFISKKNKELNKVKAEESKIIKGKENEKNNIDSMSLDELINHENKRKRKRPK